MALEVVSAADHLGANDRVIHGHLLENLRSFHHIAKGGITTIDKVQSSWCEFGFVEEEEKLGGTIIKGFVRVGPAQGPQGPRRGPYL